GNPTQIFTRDAVLLIHERSRGIPRVISVLCDNALLTGFGLGQKCINRGIVLEILQDLDLGEPELGPRLGSASLQVEAERNSGEEFAETADASIVDARLPTRDLSVSADKSRGFSLLRTWLGPSGERGTR